jgi:putative effector of murein hydrolase LrgA (UPF0299 family)
MSEEKDRGRVSGLFFVACMFVGGGIGLALGRPDVGGAIGMGVGFILMAFARTREEPVEIRIPSSASAYFLLLLGLAFVVSGLGIIYFRDILYPYMVGIFVILFGLGFVVMASGMLKKGQGGKGSSGGDQGCT